MGLIASIYKAGGASCSNGGISAGADEVCIVNVGGPFEPREGTPAVLLVKGNLRGLAKVVEAEPDGDGGWRQATGRGAGPMAGGCYVGTPDSRFSEAVEAITGARWNGAVPLHDRYER